MWRSASIRIAAWLSASVAVSTAARTGPSGRSRRANGGRGNSPARAQSAIGVPVSSAATARDPQPDGSSLNTLCPTSPTTRTRPAPRSSRTTAADGTRTSASPVSVSVGTCGSSPLTSGDSGAAGHPRHCGTIPPKRANEGSKGANVSGGTSARRRCASGSRDSGGAVRSHGRTCSSHCVTRFAPAEKRSTDRGACRRAPATSRASGARSPRRQAAIAAGSSARTAGLRSDVSAASTNGISAGDGIRRTIARRSANGSRVIPRQAPPSHSARLADGRAA